MDLESWLHDQGLTVRELALGQVDAEVWEDRPVSRIHYRVTLEDGMWLEIFKNMDHWGWYRQNRDGLGK